MVTLVVGLGLVVFGLVGVSYAPTIVKAQHRHGMEPFENGDGIDESDRVRVTRATGVVAVLVGTVLVASAIGLV
ncbi:hypothetical protein [Halopiger djelfimassiliensis]|uniref:hypothetical protein n=1 Tax=Halopiger djelfimassiliensis TaxID=1293047 RepID=UPI000677EB47|nr:hypothetical protein [Halopiger djelfimassiliensis]